MMILQTDWAERTARRRCRAVYELHPSFVTHTVTNAACSNNKHIAIPSIRCLASFTIGRYVALVGYSCGTSTRGSTRLCLTLYVHATGKFKRVTMPSPPQYALRHPRMVVVLDIVTILWRSTAMKSCLKTGIKRAVFPVVPDCFVVQSRLTFGITSR